MASSALGIDPASLASQYTQIERQVKDQSLNNKNTQYTNQIKAVNKLKTDLGSFLTELKDSQKAGSALLSNTATASVESAMTLSADSDAVSGEYDMFVQQLAQSHQIALSLDTEQALSTDGELTIGVAGENFTVDLANLGPDATLKQLANAINNHDDNSGVKATVMRSGDETYLVMTSEESGADNLVDVSFNGGTDANGANITNAIANKTELTQAQDAIVKLGASSNLTVTSASNTLKDVFDGVTIDLKEVQKEGDSPIHISVAQDKESTKENVQSFVDKFNSIISSIEDSDILKRDVSMRGLARSLKNDLQGLFEGQTLYSVGIEFDRKGKLTIDNDRFDEAMTNNPEKLGAMLTGENGLMGKLEQRIEPYSESFGLLTSKKDSLQKSLDLVVEKQKQHDLKMEHVYNRYLAQFTQMQQTISQLESTMGQF